MLNFHQEARRFRLDGFSGNMRTRIGPAHRAMGIEWAKFGWNLEIEISHVPSPKLALPPPHLTDGGGMPFLLFPHGRKIPSRDAKLAEIFKFAERCPFSSQAEMRLVVCPAADFIASFIHHENESSITIFPESAWRGSGSYSTSSSSLHSHYAI